MPSKKDKNDLALSPFLNEIESRFDSISYEELKTLILDHAKGLEKKDRAGFLGIFKAPPETKAEPQEDSGQALIESVDAFIDQLESGAYVEGFEPDEYYYDGWDYDDYEEHIGGDESWASDMDDLFAETSEYFLAGDMSVAAQAYGKLLKTFLLEEEGDIFCGPENAQDMVNTDLPEAKARYFRALYEITPENERANLLFEEMAFMYYVAESKIALQSIIDTRKEPLPDLDEFLPQWINRLQQKHITKHHGILNLWNWLLREAVLMRGGIEGLAELASKEGDVHPEAYDDWVTLLIEDKNYEGALNAAREGVDRIIDSSSKASLADRLSDIALKVDDKGLALEARIRAWRSYPSLKRLLSLCSEGKPDDKEVGVRIKAEYDYFLRGNMGIKGSLKYMLKLLAGDYDSPINCLKVSKSIGWSSEEHPGRIVFPFLLAVGSGKSAPPPNAALSKLWEEMDRGDWSLYYHDWNYKKPKDKEDALTYQDLLGATMLHHPVTEKQRLEYLDVARGIARKRMTEIVSNKYRNAYERTAQVMVACAEAYYLAGKKEEGFNIIRNAHDQFPRHIAFRRELDKLVKSSSLLPNEWMRKR